MDSRELIRRYVHGDGILLPEDETQARIAYSQFISELRLEPLGRLSAEAIGKARHGAAMAEDCEIARRALERPRIPPPIGIPPNDPFR